MVLLKVLCVKLVYRRELETIKIGSKNYFTRSEIIRYLQPRAISAVNITINDIKHSA